MPLSDLVSRRLSQRTKALHCCSQAQISNTKLPHRHRLYAASQVQQSHSSSASAGDLLGSSTTDLTAMSASTTLASQPFDAIIAIGVLIKGETMHFEYISDAVSQGLMRVGLDLGIPVIFGVLTVLNDDQAKARAGLTSGSHNHGEDWGLAAVELGVKRGAWAKGRLD